jgi:hypothetical protein
MVMIDVHGRFKPADGTRPTLLSDQLGHVGSGESIPTLEVIRPGAAVHALTALPAFGVVARLAIGR